LLQKLYVVIEGSPKRHGEYLACVSDLCLNDGAIIMQSLCSTRWYARSVNLRIVQRCLPAVFKYLETQRDSDSVGLFKSVNDVEFIFGVVFLNELFLMANTTSEALQSCDTDLAAAAIAIEDLKRAVHNFRSSDCEYDRMYEVAIDYCTKLGVQLTGKSKRKRTVPAALQTCVMESFLTKSSDGLATERPNADLLKRQLKVDFFNPVLDAVLVSLESRFGHSSSTVIKYISSALTLSSDFDNDITHLCKVAKLDAGICCTQGKLLLDRPDYKSPNVATSLQSLASKMIALNHHVIYKQYYQLVVYLLTLPVTSATCERAHSKVDLIKTAVRSSMKSERLQDLVLLSAEKHMLDAVDLDLVINRFADRARGLPL
jgi:hypothetical protein